MSGQARNVSGVRRTYVRDMRYPEPLPFRRSRCSRSRASSIARFGTFNRSRTVCSKRSYSSERSAAGLAGCFATRPDYRRATRGRARVTIGAGVQFPAADIQALLRVEKIVTVDWRREILDRVRPVGRHRVRIAAVARGELHVYGRCGTDPDDYSTGLVLYDLSNNATTLLRLNGPHPGPHTNRFPKHVTLDVVPHAHYLTELYQRELLAGTKVQPTGFALPTTAYRDIDGAMRALARRANIVAARPELPLTTRSLP